nr:hypothetical protein B11C_190017 [Bartonella sp. 1-1C]
MKKKKEKKQDEYIIKKDFSLGKKQDSFLKMNERLLFDVRQLIIVFCSIQLSSQV